MSNSVLNLEYVQGLQNRIAELVEERDDAVFCHKVADENRALWLSRAVQAEERIRLALTWLPNNPGTAMGCLQEKPE